MHDLVSSSSPSSIFKQTLHESRCRSDCGTGKWGAGITTMTTPEPGADGAPVAGRWASLPGDLVRLVASRVLAGDLLGYVRFRAVCAAWRSAAACPRGRGVADPRFHPRRWMMLPEGHGLRPGHPDLRGYIRFLNLDTGALVRAHLPLLADHCAIDSVDGLLVLLREEDSAVRLLHPFTGDIAELPPLGTLLPQLAPLLVGCPEPYMIRRLARTVVSSASFSAGSITVMLALDVVHHVAFATTLDRQWTLPSWSYQPGCRPPLSFQGKLYMANYVLFSSDFFEIFQIDPPVKDGVDSGYVLHPPKLIATVPEGNLVMPLFLVECDSEILLLGDHENFYRSRIVVFKLTDLVMQRCIPITSIRGNTLFIAGRSFNVAPKALPTLWVTVLSSLIQQSTILCSTTLVAASGRQQPMSAAFMVLHRVLVASSTLSTTVVFAIDGVVG